jgi:hypothetical protein
VDTSEALRPQRRRSWFIRSEEVYVLPALFEGLHVHAMRIADTFTTPQIPQLIANTQSDAAIMSKTIDTQANLKLGEAFLCKPPFHRNSSDSSRFTVFLNLRYLTHPAELALLVRKSVGPLQIGFARKKSHGNYQTGNASPSAWAADAWGYVGAMEYVTVS